MYTKETATVKFQLFDKYDNQYIDSSLATKLEPEILYASGKTTGVPTMYENYNFGVTVQPIYPPRQFSFIVNYRESERKAVPVFVSALSTTVLTRIDWEKTDIQGEKLAGVPVDTPFFYNILVRDSAGYCFEDAAKVVTKIRGPYLTNDIGNETPYLPEQKIFTRDGTVSAVLPETSSDFSLVTSTCNRYYNATFNEEDIKYVGY